LWGQALSAFEVLKHPRRPTAFITGSIARRRSGLSVASVIIPERRVTEGVLVKATSLVWAGIIEQLQKDWTKAFEIPPRVWEEIIAGAFLKAGFDEVILTPRSNDHGRDVIAVRKGVGSIRILDSVKAYGPGHLVTKEEVHALMGVVALDPTRQREFLLPLRTSLRSS